MFAVIKTGGKQYKVAQDDILKIERLEGAAGDTILFEDVLMLGGDGDAVEIGAPLVEGARVAAEVVDQTRGEKLVIFKKTRRHTYRRKKGHRQDLTLVKILEILEKGQQPSAQAKKSKSADKKPAVSDTAESKDASASEGNMVEPRLLKAPEGSADDLSKISGVGPKLVERLNELGVYNYSQIAEWTPENIDWLDQHLKFKGRVERDNWVDQAKELAKDAE